jgi:acyl-coenzyme A thioesterase PaaI-like protein
MGVVRFISRKFDFIPQDWLLQVYPPFLFFGAKITSVDHQVKIELPLRWYNKNFHGTMFGGLMCAVSDPFSALLTQRLLGVKKVDVWTKKNCVEFMRPATSTLTLTVVVSDEDLQAIQKSLDEDDRAVHSFTHFFTDRRGREVAKVENTIFVRLKTKRGRKKSPLDASQDEEEE